ncbi:transmembrane sensor domain-containing protein [Scytonema hofmannii PCC 7110]|uniref:Transmembrane sensor domain-containing protein n=1 Tax=Scytonema hofmannii PCC 7110 TaxID=128403 RepID=A0A139XCI4_9CYAN|nr:CHASE2 domain-containing protein [Scytonema hofmannii]KYC42408.1 transmembrane sensor domain-containing protein [Scytonema hofmannii PCC 7110]
MSRLVVICLGQGNLYEGFPSVRAYIGEADNTYRMKFAASLPKAPEIAELYRNWQLLHSALYHRLSFRRGFRATSELDDILEIETGYITNISELDIQNLCQQLLNRINTWLNSTEFRKIEQQLRTHLKQSEEIRFIIETNDDLLRRLPWHLWDFFEDYPRAEVALSNAEYQQVHFTSKKSQREKLRILAIFGNSQGIDISQDRELLEKLSTEAEIEFLVEPNLSSFHHQLWEKPWDILFFAGHSSSQEKNGLQLNQTDTITLEQLKYALKQAIYYGLRLAIFNSCDGVGLSQQLQELHIPQVIVMREPVPDVVAQEFLKSFLAEFSRGHSLYTAVRCARERLQALEEEYPCATWLPVICQNPAEPVMTWNVRQIPTDRDETAPFPIDNVSAPEQGQIRLVPRSVIRSFKHKTFAKNRIYRTNNHRFLTLLVVSVFVTALVMGIRHLGILQSSELRAYDHFVQLRPVNEKPDPRLLLITVDEADIQYQVQKNMNMRWSISDQAMAQLLQKLEKYQPKTIGIDIYRDFPTDPNYPYLSSRLQQDDRLFAVCKVSAPNDGASDGTPSPPEVPKKRLGFSDFVADADGIPRRQLIHLTPPLESPCVAEYAFSYAIARHYLGANGIESKINKEGNLQIGNTVFHQLTSHTSGYQNIDAAGYQILLNYRSMPSLENIAQKVSLREILDDKIQPELLESVKNRVVLIGVTAPSSSDFWATPYSSQGLNKEKQIPGMFIQAHMLGQILSAVLDGRPLIWWWSGWIETFWVWVWAFIGGAIAWQIRQPVYLWSAIAIGSFSLFTICFGIFTQMGWIPSIPPALALVFCAVVLKVLPRPH